ncbi:hypothetical protein HYU11_03805 [Candidatus Woesearchaeota archaeon]|nr:hypothetical protein [Candidatus Woesearchaeota archaeon]
MLNMSTKAIRGIKDEEWAEIKAMASKEGMPISRFIVKMAENNKEKNNREAWEKILSWRAKDPKEMAEVEKRIKEFRKGFVLREFK